MKSVEFNPHSYNYLLGRGILVAPIVSEGNTSFSVDFPEGSNWVYWWNHSTVYKAGSTAKYNQFPLDEYPVYFINGIHGSVCVILLVCYGSTFM